MTALKQIANQMRPYMKSCGFNYSRNCFYKINHDIAYCIQFDMPSGFVYATFYVMPLYIPCQNRYYTYGKRINALRNSKLKPLNKDAHESEIAKWCEIISYYLDNFIFPFFEKISNPRKIVTIMEENRNLLDCYFACPDVQLYRLRLFSYLYTYEFAKIPGMIKEYQNVVRNSSFLSASVQNYYLHEAEFVGQLIAESAQRIQDYCQKTVEETVQKCFYEK